MDRVCEGRRAPRGPGGPGNGGQGSAGRACWGPAQSASGTWQPHPEPGDLQLAACWVARPLILPETWKSLFCFV